MLRRLSFLFALTLASSLFALEACGDGAASPSSSALDATSDAPVTPDDAALPDAGPPDDLGELGAFCTQFTAAECARQRRCGGDAVPECESLVEGYCRMYMRAEMAPAVAAGLLTFDRAQAAKCLSAPPDVTCQGNGYWSIADCLSIFRGTVPNGGKCYSLYFYNSISECKDGTCDRPEQLGGCYPGTCQAWLSEGAPCIGDGGGTIYPGCGPGQRCSESGTCAKELGPGDPCTIPGMPCRLGSPMLTCAPLADGGDAGYACAFGRDVGASCTAGGTEYPTTCRSLACIGGRCADTTDAGATICAVWGTPCPDGTVCTYESDPPTCAAPLDAGATCVVSHECSAGTACILHGNDRTCDPPPTTNQPCVNECAPGHICMSVDDAALTCVPLAPDGGACRGAGDIACAAGLVCNAASKRCLPIAKYGEACSADTDCQRGLYCDSADSADSADQTAKTCRPWKVTGTQCSRDGECAYGQGCTAAGVCNSVCITP